MIAFDCKYVLKVSSHMKDVYWTGYILDLFSTPDGDFARLVFVYPDIGVFDTSLLLRAELNRQTTVTIMNLYCTFIVKNLRKINENALIIHNGGISIDVASGISFALSAISKLSKICHKLGNYIDIADCGGMSMSVEDTISMHTPCSDVPF